MKQLASGDFAAHLNATFRIRLAADRIVDGRLLEVKELGAAVSDRRQPFSVVFELLDADVWPQAVYRVSHSDLGELDLFLVPIDQNGDGVCYEAVFT